MAVATEAIPFRVDDLKNADLLIAKLRRSPDPLSAYLRNALSAETRRLLDLYEEPNTPADVVHRALVDDLNRLINGPCLYTDERFADVQLSDQTRGLLAKLNGEEAGGAHLNRLLLEEAYPGEIGFQPYVGPRPFTRKDQSLFFGRDDEVNELLCLVVAHQATLLYAQSGAGKTSLINAGLLPALEKEEFEVLPLARVRGSLPAGIEADRVPNLYVFYSLMSWSGSDGKPPQLVGKSLAQFLRERPPCLGADGEPLPRVVIFDQFEELFTFYPDRWRDRDVFFQQVAEALDAERRLRVLFAMRDDYSAHLDPYVHWLPEQLRPRLRLERMSGDAALLAVKGPLAGTDHSFAANVAEGLVQELLEIRVETSPGQVVTVTGNYVEPVQLQAVCQNLWRNLPPGTKLITGDAVARCGNVDEALKNLYEMAVKTTVRKTGLVEENLRHWFSNRLITANGTRGTVFRGGQETEGMPNGAVDILENLHIIRAELRAGARWYELTHDRFIGPIQESNRAWRGELDLERVVGEIKRRGWAIGLAVALVLLIIAIIGWVRANTQRDVANAERDKAEKATEEARLAQQYAANAKNAMGLQASDLLVEVGQGRAETRGAESIDISGAVLWFTDALQTFLKHKLSEDPDKRFEVSHRIRLGCAWRRMPKLAQVLFQQELRSAEFSPDGRYIVTTTKNDKLAQVWDVKTGGPAFKSPLLCEQPVNYASFSTDGQYVGTACGAAGSDSGTVQIWSAKDGSSLLTLPKHGGRVVFLAFAGIQDPRVLTWSERPPDSTLGSALKALARSVLASIGVKHHSVATTLAQRKKQSDLRVWSLAEGKFKAEFLQLEGNITEVAISPDGNYVLTVVNEPSGTQSKVQVWSVENPSKPPVGLVHSGPINFAGFCKIAGENPSILTASGEPKGSEGQAIIWDAKWGTKRVEPFSHPGAVLHAALSPDGRRLATCGADNTARVWEVVLNWRYAGITLPYHPGKLLQTLRHQGQVYHAAFSPDSRLLVTGSRDQLARVWDTATGELVVPPLDHTGTVYDVAFSPDGRSVYTTSNPPIVRIWDLDTGDAPPSFLRTTGAVSHAVWSEDGRYVVTGGKDRTGERGEARVWALASGEAVSPPLPHDKPVRYVALVMLDAGRCRVVTLGEDNQLRIWVVPLGRPNGSLRPSIVTALPPGLVVKALASSPDGRWLVVASGQRGKEEGEAQVYDAANGQAVGERLPHPGAVTYAAFSEKKGRLITLSSLTNKQQQEGVAVLWEITANRQVRKLASLKGHEEPLTYAVFSHDSDRVITTSTDDTARIWDLTIPGAHPYHVLPHTADVVFAAFSKDDSLVVTAGMDQKAVMWDPLTGARKASLEHNGAVMRASFSVDGRYLVTASQDGQHSNVIVWDANELREIARQKQPGRVLCAVFRENEPYLSILSSFVPPLPPSGTPENTSAAARFLPELLQVRAWDLSPEKGELTALLDLSEMLAARSDVANPARTDKNTTGADLEASLLAPSIWRVIPNPVRLRAENYFQDYWQLLKDRYLARFQSRPRYLAYLREADVCEISGQWESALWHLSQLIASDPNDRGKGEYFARRGHAHAALKQWDDAIADYSKGLALLKDGDPEAGRWWGERARADVELKNWSQASTDFGKAVRLEANDWRLWAEKAAVHLELDKANPRQEEMTEALVAYSAAINLKPSEVSLLHRRAEIYDRMGKWAEAAKDYTAAIALEPAKSELFEKRARVLAESGELGRAIQDRVQAAELHAKQRQWPKAEANYTKALSLERKHPLTRPELTRIHVSRGEARLQQKEWQKALDDYDQALELDAKEWRAWQGRGQANANLKHSDAAIADFQKALQLNPKDWSLRTSFATSLIQMGQRDKAIGLLDDAIDPKEQSGDLWVRRASLYTNLLEWRKAIADYQKAIELRPSDYWLYLSKAQVHLQLQEWDQAAADFTEVFKSQPNNTWLLARRAQANAGRGRWKEAREDLAKTVNHDPKDLNAWHQLAILALQEKNAGEYHRICTALLGQLPATNVPSTANSIVWTCVLGIDKEIDTAELVELSERTVAQFSKNHHYLNTLGAALYRAGDFARAIQRIEEGRKLPLPAMSPSAANTLGEERVVTLDLLFLAMAHYRLGHTQEYSQMRNDAVRWIEANCGAALEKSGRPTLNLWWKLELELLRREAEELPRR